MSGETKEDQVQLQAVTPLHKQTSKHDLVWKGRTFHLDIGPCAKDGNCFLVLYYEEEDAPIPAFVKTMLKNQGDEVPKHREVVTAEHVTLRWWEKMLGVCIEKKIAKTVEKVKKELQTRMERISAAERLKESLM